MEVKVISMKTTFISQGLIRTTSELGARNVDIVSIALLTWMSVALDLESVINFSESFVQLLESDFDKDVFVYWLIH